MSLLFCYQFAVNLKKNFFSGCRCIVRNEKRRTRRIMANLSICPLGQKTDFNASESNWTWSGSSTVESVLNSSNSRIPAAIMIPTGIMLYVLSLLTFVGNAMVLHAIRTEKRLQTVSKVKPRL